MTDATTQRVSTEQVRELLAGATPGPWRGDRNDGTVKYAIIGADGRYVMTCDHKNGRYGFVVGDEWGDVVGGEHDADERLTLAAPDLAADLLDARAEIARLTADLAAARELRGVPVEEHARAVREAWGIGIFKHEWSLNDVESWWLEEEPRRDLIATLTRSGVPEARAAALADGVGGGE